MSHIPRCPVCGNFSLPGFYEPRGYALCPRCRVILRRLRDRLVPLHNIEPERISLETSLAKDLSLSSLDVVELVMALEEEYGVEITDGEAEQIQTVEDVVHSMESRESR